MRYFLLLTILNMWAPAYAQHAKHSPLPRAKILLDSAAGRYTHYDGSPAKLKEIYKLVDAAIKADDKYYDAWLNKMTLQSQHDQFEDALKTARTMAKKFPTEMEVVFMCGVLEYRAGHKTESLATFNKLLKYYDGEIKNKPKDPNMKSWLINKGIILILADHPETGKPLLLKIHDAEKEPYSKSYLAFYINSSKEEIINDRTPGK